MRGAHIAPLKDILHPASLYEAICFHSTLACGATATLRGKPQDRAWGKEMVATHSISVARST